MAGTYQQYLHSINILTGQENTGSPVLINPTFAGSANFGGASQGAPQGTPNTFEQSGTTTSSVTGVIPFYALGISMRARRSRSTMESFTSPMPPTPTASRTHGEILGFNESNLVPHE